MKYRDAINKLRTIYGFNEEHWLIVMFFDVDSGYYWWGGELHSVTLDDNEFTPEEMHNKYVEFCERYAQRNGEKKLADMISAVEHRRNIKVTYKSNIWSVHNDVKDDWAEAACKALRLAHIKLIAEDNTSKMCLRTAYRYLLVLACNRNKRAWMEGLDCYREKPVVYQPTSSIAINNQGNVEFRGLQGEVGLHSDTLKFGVTD